MVQVYLNYNRSDVPPSKLGGIWVPITLPSSLAGKRENFLGGLARTRSTSLRASRSPNLRVETPPQATKGPFSFGKQGDAFLLQFHTNPPSNLTGC